MPIAIGLAALLLCYFVLFLMPESRGTDERAAESSLESDSDSDDSISIRSRQLIEESHGYQRRSIIAFFWNNNMPFALPIFLVGVFRGISLRVLLPYVSVRFGWKLEDVCLELFVDTSKLTRPLDEHDYQ